MGRAFLAMEVCRRVVEIVAWLSIQPVKPIDITSSIDSSVGPKLALSKKRAASFSLGNLLSSRVPLLRTKPSSDSRARRAVTKSPSPEPLTPAALPSLVPMRISSQALKPSPSMSTSADTRRKIPPSKRSNVTV